MELMVIELPAFGGRAALLSCAKSFTMDPSQELASEVEFNGTESGWTTYIGSPIYNEVFNGDDEHSADIRDYGNKYKNAHRKIYDDDNKGVNNVDFNRDTDEESDDSMVSDAASGPSHLQLVCLNSEGSHGLDFTEHTDNDNEKIPLTKRPTKQVRKKRYEGMVEKEESSLLVADTAASHV
ncbi:unnamed protein product [Sphenostylis stenocarpa]|uniref:Uncharacterized protein n=1 Tax=Sphenostylis stenocarpa TaxID=92480 RepID=A0AA86S3J5_9FABA|nr:unnamed protein product [Sphenostylis stenocarpa]